MHFPSLASSLGKFSKKVFVLELLLLNITGFADLKKLHSIGKKGASFFRTVSKDSNLLCKMSKTSKRRISSDAFDPKTINELKESFGIMDQNKDGVIDKSDLKDLYASLGQIPNDSQIDKMLKEADQPLNFSNFLSLFGKKLMGSDPAETILGAFKIFDKRGTGFIDEKELLKVLGDKRFGEPFTDAEIEAMYAGKPPIADGQVDYNAFVKLITTGAQDELSKP